MGCPISYNGVRKDADVGRREGQVDGDSGSSDAGGDDGCGRVAAGRADRMGRRI